MPGDINVKICGLTTPDHVRVAADAGARYLGFNFFPKSPRYVSPQQAAVLTAQVPVGVAKVALVVNASDEELDAITRAAPFDMLQLHGSESVARVQAIKERYGLPVIKVIGVADADDLPAIDTYSDVADQLLIDAKPPKNAVLPGGNGLAFDWRLLAGRKYWRKPWMLAGGLTPENVAEAIRMTGARQVDVASGVESAPGVKDPELIRAFITAAG
ncbi:phosphoribosylanthranilate isomerase [Ruegeria sp. HKCCD7255]|uniref:phosphoribosylanthranilate isomerase n=1 Tax=Ruegeria sp. HKCCD7255 TaxID=2683004 RepID=UPI0014888797|nr:phosphoribosylanthranilate isomerase [Ruegeria sp. HKCCD7255]